jgi:hypothetical protein
MKKRTEKIMLWDGGPDETVPLDDIQRVELLSDVPDESGLVPVRGIGDIDRSRPPVYALVRLSDLREPDKFKAWPTGNGVNFMVQDRVESRIHIRREFVPEAIKALQDFLKSKSKGKTK